MTCQVFRSGPAVIQQQFCHVNLSCLLSQGSTTVCEDLDYLVHKRTVLSDSGVP